MEKLNDFGFHSYEEALKGKLELKRLNGDLYIRLLISEKCRDYALHRDDLAYIRAVYYDMEREYKEDNDFAYQYVGRIVYELVKDRTVQQFFFDIPRNKIVGKTRGAQETLMRVFKNKKRSRMLIEFCLKLLSGVQLSTLITSFNMQRNTAEYKVFIELSPLSVN